MNKKNLIKIATKRSVNTLVSQDPESKERRERRIGQAEELYLKWRGAALMRVADYFIYNPNSLNGFSYSVPGKVLAGGSFYSPPYYNRTVDTKQGYKIVESFDGRVISEDKCDSLERLAFHVARDFFRGNRNQEIALFKSKTGIDLRELKVKRK